ncbi:MAG TPA: tRNA (N6-isopentenyl adenosine(37)-C2)-methylthiotransferase MiaB [Caldithrix sp.]|nr:tRNA (N6-isopentenyl adenosine(37)-C2)-methylthiotransferase MiaB [Caldithrix sp.]
MKTVYIETYGCQMNEYDTELVRAVLSEHQYRFVENEREADIVMLNTCSVRENANRKVYNRIHTLRHTRNGDPVLIGVLGCMATNFRKSLLDNRQLKIDFIAGPDSYKRLPNLIRQVEQKGSKAYDVTLSEFETYSDVYPRRAGGVNAWVAVMRGCNNFCTFCVVPYTRGRERSRSPQNIVEEVKRLSEEGFRQVTLLGQNVNSYRYEEVDFAGLLEQVSRVEGIRRLRFTSPHPKDFPHSLLHVVAENPRVCKHIHLPLQAGNDRILEIMNRTYTQKEYLDLVDNIRSHFPDMVLTTDIIVGFPSETDREFEDTVKVMEAVEFDSAFIFKYSERQGTIAARKYPDDVSEEKKTERIVRLNEIQKAHSLKKNRAHIGQTLEVLIEQESTRRSPDDFQGRTDGNKLVIFPAGNYRTGDFVAVKITDATAHVLKGEVVKK